MNVAGRDITVDVVAVQGLQIPFAAVAGVS